MFRRPLATFVSLFLLMAAGMFITSAAETSSKVEGRQAAAIAILADIQQATWIRDGKSAHVLYVFVDPNCPYCHKVYDMLRPYVQRGEVEVRWIPIGRLMVTSIGKAAALLEAKDPTEAFHANERGFSQETGSFGGIDEEPAPRDETLKKLNANLVLLNRTGSSAVPTLLFRTKNGKADIIRGAPPAAFFEKLVKELE